MDFSHLYNSTLEGGFDAYRGGSVIVCAVTFAILCSACLGLRFLSHRISQNPISWEDWLMIPAWAMTMGLCAIVICSESLVPSPYPNESINVEPSQVSS